VSIESISGTRKEVDSDFSDGSELGAGTERLGFAQETPQCLSVCVG